MMVARGRPTAIRLYVLDTGLIGCANYTLYSPSAQPGTYREMSSCSYLTVHPEGLLLWDTGIADSVAAEPDGETSSATELPLRCRCPGTPPGHQGLLLDLPATGRLLLAGDLLYSVADYTASAVRELNVDPVASRESIDAAKALETTGATVWLHHDTDAQQMIRTAPHFYT
jgi:hypothetical protein